MAQTARRLDKKGNGKFSVVVGIGGIHCPCCNLGSIKESRVAWNRLDRGRAKHKVAEALAEVELDEILDWEEYESFLSCEYD